MLSIAELNETLKAVTAPAESFYRRFYGMDPAEPPREIRSIEEWHALPIITKDDLAASPLKERVYGPLSQLDHIRASSGTSGKPPLFSPRTHVLNMEYRLQFHDFKKPFLAFTVPLMPHWHADFMRAHDGEPRVISYDPKSPRASVALARDAGVDAFSVFVYHVNALGEEMKRVGMNEQIRLAEITGEVCSRAQYEYIRATFPNATIVQSYNSSEVEDAHIGMPCKAMDGTEPLAVYHPKATHYLELIDPETGAPIEPLAGAEGDLLITARPSNASFPLIRYRIGDTVKIVEETCPHGTFSFTTLGRTDFDFVKLPGGILRADEIDRAIQTFRGRIGAQFTMIYDEAPSERGSLPKLTLAVEATQDFDFNSFAREFERVLRIGPSRTLADAIQDGRMLPLHCTAYIAGSGKRRRLARADR